MAIETFTLVRERCLLGHLNIRTEMHGEDREAACDLKFSFSSANNLLSKLHPDLRALFYRANETRDLVNPDHMPHLRFPLLGEQTYKVEIPRTRLRVHDAKDPAHDVLLGGGKTNNFKLVLKEGGTVEWSFRCQFSKPDEDSIAKLMRVLNQVVPITLECADEEEKPDNFDKVEQLSLAGTTPSEARIKAENMFDKPTTDMKLADPEQVETDPVTLDTPKPKRVAKALPISDLNATVVQSVNSAINAIGASKAKRVSRKAAEVE